MPGMNLYDYLNPMPQTIEPSVRPVASLPAPAPSSAGADVPAGSPSDSLGDINPLYLLGLAGSVLTRRPGEPAGIAERLLPTYLSQQQHRADQQLKQQLNAADAAEYKQLSDILEQAHQGAGGDWNKMADLYSQALQKTRFQNTDVAKSAYAAVPVIRDKGMVQALDQKDARAADLTNQQVQNGHPLGRSEAGYAQLFTLNGGRSEAGLKHAGIYGKSIQTTNQGNQMAQTNWNLPDPTTRYSGGFIQEAAPDRPAQVVTQGPDGSTSAVVPGSVFPQSQGGRTVMVDDSGTGVSTFANRPPKLEITDDLKKGLERIAGQLGMTADQVIENAQNGDKTAQAMLTTATNAGKAVNDFKLTPDQLFQAGNTLPGRSAAELSDPDTYLKPSTNPPLNESGQPAYVNPAGAMLVNEDQRKAASAGAVAGEQAKATLPYDLQKAEATVGATVRANRATTAGDTAKGSYFRTDNFQRVELTEDESRQLATSGGQIARLGGAKVGQAKSQTDADTIQLLSSAMPAIETVKELLPQVLAAAPGQNLTNAMKIAVQRKVLSPAQIAVFDAGVHTLALEEARAVSGGSRVPVTIYKDLLNNTVPVTTQTAQTGLAVAQYIQGTMRNRMKAILGEPVSDKMEIPAMDLTTTTGKKFR